jgi:hypothetical protein
VPNNATPIAPPVWRAAFNTPEAIPPRSAGVASMIAAVAAGILSAIPMPTEISGITSTT